MGIKVKGHHMNGSTFWTIKYINGSVFFFSKARYMNGVGFEILAYTRTTITHKLPHELEISKMQMRLLTLSKSREELNKLR